MLKYDVYESVLMNYVHAEVRGQLYNVSYSFHFYMDLGDWTQIIRLMQPVSLPISQAPGRLIVNHTLI